MTAARSLFEVPGVNLAAVAPEVVLSAGGLLLLLVGAGLRRRRPRLLSGAVLAILLAAALASLPALGRSELAFDGAVALDGFATFLKLVLLAGGAVAVLISHPFLDEEDLPATEYFGLVLLATAGMMLMVAAADLILVFLALETFSLSFYVLAAFRRRRLDSQEGALKYFLTGSFASAFFLYGVALVYGGTGTTRLAGVAQFLATSPADERLLAGAGLALLLVGLAFKVAAVPFHMWTPDVYQGSPAPAVGFMAAGSKVAGFAVLLRALVAAFPVLVSDWRPVLTGIAVATMVLGSVVAVAQTNVKRMLAYSAIAHSGFLLIGVLASNARGISGSLFYLGIYTFAILGSFAVVYAVGGKGEEKVSLADYRGLWSDRPFLAAVFALLLISLAGIPPTAGFWAKVEVFFAAAEAGQIPIVVVGVLTSAIAAFFYLRVIVLMFLEEPGVWAPRPAPTVPPIGAALLVAAAVVVALGVLPTPLLEAARSATLVFR